MRYRGAAACAPRLAVCTGEWGPLGTPRPYVFPGDSFSQKRSSLVIPYSKAPSIYPGKGSM